MYIPLLTNWHFIPWVASFSFFLFFLFCLYRSAKKTHRRTQLLADMGHDTWDIRHQNEVIKTRQQLLQMLWLPAIDALASSYCYGVWHFLIEICFIECADQPASLICHLEFNSKRPHWRCLAGFYTQTSTSLSLAHLLTPRILSILMMMISKHRLLQQLQLFSANGLPFSAGLSPVCP